MDGDHVPELLITLEVLMEVKWFVYTMQNDRVRYIDSFSGDWGGSSLDSCPKGGIYVGGAHMEWVWNSWVTKQGNALKVKEIYHIDYIHSNEQIPEREPNSVALFGQALEYYY
jgi:hypothetical protein